MKKFISFLYLFLLTSSLFSQNYFKGIICDIKTKQPIPYCNIYIQGKTGSISNENGKCLLEINSATEKDSITISNILYYKKHIPVVNLSKQRENDTIFLTPKTYELDEVIVTNKKCKEVELGVKKIRLGGRDARQVCVRPMRGYVEKVAVFIENKFSKLKKVKLKSVRFNITDNSKTGFLFKVHIYDINNKSFPGKELLLDNVIRKFPMTKGWVEIDLSTYGIVMPPKGLFVAIEFLDYYIPRLEELVALDLPYSWRRDSSEYFKELDRLDQNKTWLLLQQSQYKHKKYLTYFYGVKRGWVRKITRRKDTVIDNACISAKFCITK